MILGTGSIYKLERIAIRVARSTVWGDEHFAEFTELFQPECIRLPSTEHGRISGSASRLDRILLNLPLEAFALLEIKVSTMGFKPTHDISDHLPVCAESRMKGRSMGSCKIPTYIFKNADHRIILENTCREHILSDYCWAKIRDCKTLNDEECLCGFSTTETNSWCLFVV